MPVIEEDMLEPLVRRFIAHVRLTPPERGEVFRIARAFSCRDAASAAGVSAETIRARRKRLYQKLDVEGSSELGAQLLALSLEVLAGRRSLEVPRPPVALEVPPGIIVA